MKTRDAPPEKGKGKGADSASKPDGLMQFRRTAKAVFSVSRDDLLRAEEDERNKKKPKP